MKTTTRLILALAFTMTSIPMVNGQETPIDLEARKATIPVIEKRIEERDAQILEITNDIMKLHQRLDDKLKRLVTRLSGIKDSAKSGFRVGNLKIEAIDELKETVEAFRRKRTALARELKEGRTGIDKDLVTDEIAHFDGHIDMHIQQMLELSKSFTQDESVAKYKNLAGSGSNNGWYGETIEISDEWRQNRRDRHMDKKQREEVLGALRNSIERCQSAVEARRADLKDPGLSGIDRGVLEEELNVHVAMLKTREGQLEEELVVDEPNTQEVNRDVAKDLEEAVGDLIGDLERDVRVIILKHAEMNREQVKLSKVKANLEARKNWLEEYEASQTE